MVLKAICLQRVFFQYISSSDEFPRAFHTFGPSGFCGFSPGILLSMCNFLRLSPHFWIFCTAILGFSQELSSANANFPRFVYTLRPSALKSLGFLKNFPLPMQAPPCFFLRFLFSRCRIRQGFSAPFVLSLSVCYEFSSRLQMYCLAAKGHTPFYDRASASHIYTHTPWCQQNLYQKKGILIQK